METKEIKDIARVLGDALVPLIKSATDPDMIKGFVVDEIKRLAPRRLEITASEKPPVVFTQAHECLETLVQCLNAGLHVWITGPAGSGKTHACEQAAESLGLKFYAQSVCSQTPASYLLGYMDAHGRLVETDFRRAYVQGGLFVLDEADAGNANVLAVLNAALANGKCSFPDGMQERHADFRLAACANTWGQGADSAYVGRAPLDAATLDRFVFLQWPYDEKLELALAGDPAWTETVQQFRMAAQRLKLKCVISPRASIQGAKLLLRGLPEKTVKDMVLFRGLSEETKKRLIEEHKNIRAESRHLA